MYRGHDNQLTPLRRLVVRGWQRADDITEWGTPEFPLKLRQRLLRIVGNTFEGHRFTMRAASVCTASLLWRRAIDARGIENPSMVYRDVCEAKRAADDLIRLAPKIGDFLMYFGSELAKANPKLQSPYLAGNFETELRRLSAIAGELANAIKPRRGRPAGRSAAFNAVVGLVDAWKDCFGARPTTGRNSAFVAACRIILPVAGLDRADVIGLLKDAIGKSQK